MITDEEQAASAIRRMAERENKHAAEIQERDDAIVARDAFRTAAIRLEWERDEANYQHWLTMWQLLGALVVLEAVDDRYAPASASWCAHQALRNLRGEP